MRLPASCLKCSYGESVRTMITAPERWPSETIFTGIFLSARSITSGASMYAAWMRPGHQRFLDFRPAVELAVLVFELRRAGCERSCSRFRAPRRRRASVRLQVTGRPPTCSTPFFASEHAERPNGSALAAKAACRNCLRPIVPAFATRFRLRSPTARQFSADQMGVIKPAAASAVRATAAIRRRGSSNTPYRATCRPGRCRCLRNAPS